MKRNFTITITNRLEASVSIMPLEIEEKCPDFNPDYDGEYLLSAHQRDDGSWDIDFPDDTIEILPLPGEPLYGLEGGKGSKTLAYYLVPNRTGVAKWYYYALTERTGWDKCVHFSQFWSGMESVGTMRWLEEKGY